MCVFVCVCLSMCVHVCFGKLYVGTLLVCLCVCGVRGKGVEGGGEGVVYVCSVVLLNGIFYYRGRCVWRRDSRDIYK